MIKFLFGACGSGKSTYIINEIKKDCENKRHAYLIVPEQQGVISEEALANELPSSAQLQYEVLNFSRLANKVFRKHGGLKYNYVTKSAKALIMYRAICECRESLASCKIEPGHEKSYVNIYSQAISELKAYGTTLEGLGETIEKMNNPDEKVSEQLKNKLNNVHSIWASYEKLLKNSFSNDPLDDAIELVKKLKELRLKNKSFFKGKSVYIDSFYSFTQSQLNIIKEIVLGAENVTFAFDCPAETPLGATQYAKIAESYKKIASICEKEKSKLGKPDIVELKNDYTHKDNDDLLHLYKNIWNFNAPRKECKGNVVLAKCSDEFEECELVATKIREKIEEGCLFSDIAIIARNPSSYRGILDYTLDKYNIPHFFSAPSDLLGKPVVKMIFTALSAITSYKQDDIMSYIKCGYVGLEPDVEADLEAYVYRWSLQGRRCWTGLNRDDYWCANPDGYKMEFSKEQEERLKRIIEARNSVTDKLSILEEAFKKKSTVRDCAEAIFKFLEAHSTLEKLEEEKKNSKRKLALEIVQVWKSLLSALDTLVDVCGDISVNALTFSSLLQYAFIDADIGTIPTAVDTVLIADASTVRTKNHKHVFIIGVNEGVFPATVSDSSFFNDTEKTTLETHEIYLAENTATRVDDELMFFRQGISIASETIMISGLTASIDGDKRAPSIAYTRVNDLFNNVLEIVPSTQLDVLSKIYTEATASGFLGQTEDELREAILRELKLNKTVSGFTNDKLSVDEKTVRRLIGNRLKLTQSAIEKFQNCHFSYYCSKFLKIRSNKRFYFDSSKIGDMFHEIFQITLTKLQKMGKEEVKNMSSKKLDMLVKKIANNYIDTICSGIVQTQRANHLFERMRVNLLVIVRHLVEEFLHSDFEAKYFELSFDGNGIDSPYPMQFKLNDGTPVILHGIADRIDVYRNDKTTYVRIVDYKTGKKEFSMSKFEEGTQLQLFIYLFALCELRDCKFKETLLDGREELMPAGAYYLPLNIGKITEKKDLSSVSDDVEKADFLSLVKPSGRVLDNSEIRLAQDSSVEKKFSPESKDSYISADAFEEMYEGMKRIISSIGTTMLSGDASVSDDYSDFSSPCKYCEMKPFCRRRQK